MKPKRRIWPWVAAGLAGIGLTWYLSSAAPKVEAQPEQARVEQVNTPASQPAKPMNPVQRFEQTRQLARQPGTYAYSRSQQESARAYLRSKGFTAEETERIHSFLMHPDERGMDKLIEHVPLKLRNAFANAVSRRELDQVETLAFYLTAFCETPNVDANYVNKNANGSKDYGSHGVNDKIQFEDELLKKHFFDDMWRQWDPPGSKYGQGDVVAEKDRLKPEINADAAAFIIKMNSAKVPKNLHPLNRLLRINQLYAGTNNKKRPADTMKELYLKLEGKKILRKGLQDGLGTK